jgi:hypothetical protein
MTDVSISVDAPLAGLAHRWCHAGQPANVTVVIKATFRLDPELATLVAPADPVAPADRFEQGDPARALETVSDMAPLKLHPEVVVIGRVYARPGQRVRNLIARLIVGNFDKAIEVHQRRTVSERGLLVEGEPWSSAALRYADAAGGRGTWNPVGIPPQAYARRFPRISIPGNAWDPQKVVEPIGIGPISPFWPTRAERTGKNKGFGPSFHDGQIFPADIHPLFFQVAPQDQILSELRPDEKLVLEHLHPHHPRLVTRLPPITPHVMIALGGGEVQPLGINADTLLIDTERGMCSVLWRGTCPIASLQEPVRIRVTATLPDDVGINEPLKDRPAYQFEDGDSMVVDHREDTLTLATHELAALEVPPSVFRDPGVPFRAHSPVSTRPLTPPPAPMLSSPHSQVPPLPLRSSPSSPGLPPQAGVSSSLPPILSLKPHSSSSLPPNSLVPDNTPSPPMRVVSPPGETVLELSNAAARVALPAVDPRPAIEPKQTASPEKALAHLPTDLIDLLWFDRSCLPRARKRPEWKQLIKALEDRPPDLDLDDASSVGQRDEIEDRRDIFEILARGDAQDANGIEAGLDRSVRQDGKVVPPLLLVFGDLAFPFDDTEMLKAHAAVIAPFSQGDEKLTSEVTLVQDFLSTAEYSCALPMIEALGNRLWGAFARAKRAVDADTLRSHADHALLRKRKLQHREVFGGEQIRALYHATSNSPPIPTYLPKMLTAILPMYQRIRARMVVEVHLAVDQHENSSLALRVVALARVVDRRASARSLKN